MEFIGIFSGSFEISCGNIGVFGIKLGIEIGIFGIKLEFNGNVGTHFQPVVTPSCYMQVFFFFKIHLHACTAYMCTYSKVRL